ncbi:MAG: MFS transporter [Puniceicoccales bacterium]|nr:MFS transporter [Puniceicoccales bacterium]
MASVAVSCKKLPPPASARGGKNYPLLLASQFLGAFADNAILMLIIGPLTWLAREGQLTQEALRSANTFYTVLLFVPCVFFSPLAGYLNDRFAKTTCLVGGNAVKLFGAALCAASPLLGEWAQGTGYFIIGAGTCLYGPAKYGILPEILPREKLVRANGTVEMLTLLAILTGVIAGSLLADNFNGRMLIPFFILNAVYMCSLLLNTFMRRTAEDATVRLRKSIVAFANHIRDLTFSPRLCRMLIGSALFWIVGAAMKSHFQPWGLEVLRLQDNTEISLLLLTLSLGVMGGGVTAGRLHKVGDLSKAPLYGFAMAVTFVLAWSAGSTDFWLSPQLMLFGKALVVPIALLVAGAGFFAGLFLIPINAALQAESDPAKTGKTIAVQNLFDYLGMCLAGAYLFAGNKLGVSPSGIFLGMALGTAAVSSVFILKKRSTDPHLL